MCKPAASAGASRYPSALRFEAAQGRPFPMDPMGYRSGPIDMGLAGKVECCPGALSFCSVNSAVLNLASRPRAPPKPGFPLMAMDKVT